MTWKIENEKLVKKFELADFTEAMTFVNQVAELAEEANHHPDILIHSYNQIKIMIYTHDKNEITAKDYDLAEKIDGLN
mgnify:CR=1 FL=1